MFDMAATAAFIVMLRLYHDMHFVDTHMHGVQMRLKWLKNSVAAYVVVSAVAVVTVVVADKYSIEKFRGGGSCPASTRGGSGAGARTKRRSCWGSAQPRLLLWGSSLCSRSGL